MHEKTLTVNIDGDPSLLNKKIENAAKNPVNLKVDFNSKDLMSGLNEIKSAASKISDSIGKDFSKIFRGIGKDKMPMQDALNEIKNNIASVITDIGTAENQLNAIRVSPGGDGFEELRANIDGIRTSIDGISKINLSALAPPDSAIQKLSEVRSQIESLSEVDKLESYLTRGANRYAKSGLLNNSYYENMKKYVDMGGKLSDISHKESGNLSNYLKEYTQMANAVTSTGKSVSFIDNNEISGAVEQLRQLRVEEQALSQTSGGLNLLGNIKQMTDSISQISALLHTEFGREPIKINVEPNTDDLKGKIQSSVDNESVKVKVEADTATLKDQINQLLQKDSALNIVNLGGSSSLKNPVVRQRDYGIAARDAIPKLREQASELEKLFPSGRQSSQASAVLSTLSSTGVTKDLWQTAQLQANATNKDLSLSQQMDALREYISLMQKAASIKGIDTSAVMQKFGDPEKIIQGVRDIQNGVKREKNEDITNSVLQGNEKEIEANAGSIIERIQSQADGRSIAINVEPNVEGFVEKIQGTVDGSSIKIGVVDGGSNGKSSSSSSSEKLNEPGENQQKLARKEVLGNYKSGLNALATGERVITPEEEKIIQNVQTSVRDITSSGKDMTKTQEEWANNVNKVSNEVYRNFADKQLKEMAKVPNEEYLKNIDGYANKRQEIVDMATKLKDTSIDFGTKEGMDFAQGMAESIRVAKTELEGMVNEYDQIQARAKETAKLNEKAEQTRTDALKQQQKTYSQQEKEIRKNLYEGLTGKAQEELTDAFSGKQFEKFGLFDSAKVNKDGSAVLSFVKEIDGSLQKVTVTAANANGALNALKMGRFEQYATDYQTGKITQSPEQKSDIKNYQSALIAEAKGMELTGIQTSALDKIRTEYQAIVGDIDNATNAQRAFVASVQEAGANATKAISDSLTKDYNKLASGAENMLPGYSEKLDELKSHIETINGMTIDWDDEKQKAELQEQISMVEQLKAEMTSGTYTPASEASINALMQRMSTTERYNTKAFKSSEYGGQLNALKERIGGMSAGKTSVSDVKEANSEMSKLIANFQDGQKAGASFGETWKQRMGSLGAYLTTFASFYRIIATIKKIANTVKELDSAMIELEKVSDVSGQRLQQSFETSKQTAQDLGATVTDVINATADWSRLGYSQDQAEELAKTAVIYEHVGDGINIDQANESLISTLQGFKMEASDAMEIVDKFNEVANNEPIDSAGIGEALQRSAASFQAANTDLSESIALITSAMTMAHFIEI